MKKRAHAEIRFAPGEIKNGAWVSVHVLGQDAEILWDWIHLHRTRLIKLRELPDSPYVFPGEARPRLVKDAIALPPGCLSPSTFAEWWAEGDARLGLGLTPHECRHATATLCLAIKPGDFATAAAILADTEDTVRKHYARDSGQAAAASVRAALLAHHKPMFRKLEKWLETCRR